MPSTSSSTLTRSESLALAALTAACGGILANTFQGDGEPLIASLAFGGLAFAASYALIRWLGEPFKKVGFKGTDLSKAKKHEIPETMGAVCAVVYLLMMIFFIPFPFYKHIVAASGNGHADAISREQDVETGRYLHEFPHNKLASYLSALLSLQSVVILGLGDDLFDIRWRHKLFIPAFASIPILIVYFVDFGVTHVVVPLFLRKWLGELLNLSWLYYAYMSAICIFCPNSINIWAGINGLEVGQSLVVAALLVLNDALYILPGGHLAAPPATELHANSLYFLLPFIGVSLSLLVYNWYPAKVFVGDTYCYFAGMVFAVVAIQGHYSKTLLLLLMPQIFNFVYSAPQLFDLMPCPRHRLPKFNLRTGLMEPSMAPWNAERRKFKVVAELALRLLGGLRLVKLELDGEGNITAFSNMTLINLWLVWFGPLREDKLALSLLGMQAGVGLLGLWIRHHLALWLFSFDNLQLPF